MDIREMMEKSLEFSRRKFPEFWSFSTKEEWVHRLGFFALGIAGEAGEFANLVKKLSRKELYGDSSGHSEVSEDELAEELVDVLIYTLLTFGILRRDPAKEFERKYRKLEERWKDRA